MRRDLQNIALCATAVFSAADALANPSGMTVVSGTASAAASGSTLNITASQNAVLNWQTFNIAANETVNFHQPSSISIVWDRILDANPSQILGHLDANGYVVLMNQNGFYFGPNSCVNVGGFVAAGAWVTPPAAGAGAMWTYQGPPPSASIINYGQIKVSDGGSLFLVAEKIENQGVLTAPDGTLGLYAGKQVMLSERPDGRSLSAAVTLPDGSVDNEGKIVADAGTIALQAQVVNQDGLIQANSVRNNNGVIELVAGDSVNLGANSVIQANGDSSGVSDGGTVTIKSSGSYADDPASQIQVRGGANGGNGGSVEISAEQIGAVNSRLDGSARPGWHGGSLLLDPYDIELSDGSGNNSSPGTVNAGDPPTAPGSTLVLNVNTAFAGQNFSQVTLQAMHDIDLDDGLDWNLNTSIGSRPNSTLTLEAGNDINFGSGQGLPTLISSSGWSVNLMAGVNFSSPTHAIQNGVGSINDSIIQTSDGGNVTLDAGDDITIGESGSTTWNISGGSGGTVVLNAGQDITFADNQAQIDADSGGWSVSLSAGVDFSSPSLATQSGVGGIYCPTIFTGNGNITLNAGHEVQLDGSYSLAGQLAGAGYGQAGFAGYVRTFGGGNIFVTAGDGNVDTGRPASNGTDYSTYSGSDNKVDATKLAGIATDKGGNVTISAGGNIETASATIGALGAGNVNLTAGGDLDGYFYVRNGVGTVNVGGDVGALANTDLGLSSGGWNVSASGSISIGAIYNFNGAFGSSHLFDYSPGAYADLSAGDSVQLLGDPTVTSAVGGNDIYPPIFNINAGAGGVGLRDTIVLFPSAQGSLNIATTAGGSLSSLNNGFNSLIVSDGNSGDYRTFSDGHAATPVHLGETGDAVTFSIDGDLDNILLSSPGAADIFVQGDAYNFSFQGQNLAASETTKITIDGDYTVPSEVTYVTIPGITAATVYNIFQNPLNATSSVGDYLYYDPATGQLGFYGQMNAAQESELLNPTVNVLNNGVVERTASGVAITEPATFTTDTAAIDALYANSQNVPSESPGFIISGPGAFQISAHNMDLGSSTIGIQSLGAYSNPALGQTMVRDNTVLPGASIQLNLGGDLEMVSSDVFSASGGSITIQSQGSIDVGQENAPFSSLSSSPRGIYSIAGGSVTVEAVGDINVDGSRIAAYDGGDVNVISGAPSANGLAVSWADVVIGPNGVLYMPDPSAPGIVYNETTTQKSTGDVIFDAQNGTPLTDANGNPIHGYVVTLAGGGVDAGNGAGGTFPLDAYSIVEPNGTVIYPTQPQVFGSGILAFTSLTGDSLVGDINVEAGGDISAGTGGILQLAFNGTGQLGATLSLQSFEGDINAGNSGVLGQNVTAVADNGSVNGLFVASGNATINAGQNINVTALAGGNASVSGGGSVSGTVIGGGDVSLSGGDVSATAISTGGGVSGGSGGNAAFAGVAAPTAQKTTQDASQQVASDQSGSSDDEDQKKKRGKPPVLAQKVSRVTVILPKKI
jgi:filamentous hemagglutinin family protein